MPVSNYVSREFVEDSVAYILDARATRNSDHLYNMGTVFNSNKRNMPSEQLHEYMDNRCIELAKAFGGRLDYSPSIDAYRWELIVTDKELPETFNPVPYCLKIIPDIINGSIIGQLFPTVHLRF